ncbi:MULTISPECIES: hypothetical protein [unclassified Treponema]|uniref:hypothetical protein n=1 Tax=unclassified Treponema TaxID=2638727 RepID=UPI0020A5CCB5|nr:MULTISPECIES: hypothetical protein [unclassified Treponema]UTC67757.1 hypothetical protein E4O06_03575 [Treponema sp. OMZ 789]UTC70482.1 hypothetical protein E4O01_03565 [Treponema sp. OMZ 790]UTC73194.1 hypothetical protein E4O02_03715 [Treponema sp. OMZ 791]
MEEVKIIEGILIMMFIFPALAIIVKMFLAVFIHISFHRTGLAFSFYEEATKENVFFSRNAIYNDGILSSSWDRTRFIIRWCLKLEYAKEDSIQIKSIKRKFFILNMMQLLCFPLSLLWILLCLITIVLTFFLV